MGVRRKTAEEIEACVQRAVLEVQRLAVDGVAPRVRDYVALREDGPAIETLARYGVLYSDLVALAGLKPVTRGPGAGRVPASVEEVQHRLRRQSRQRQDFRCGIPAATGAEQTVLGSMRQGVGGSTG